jgi:hypothetical protein
MSSLTRQVATRYHHSQDTAATTWTIPHGLGRRPIVDAYITLSGAVQKVIPEAVTYVDANTCTVTFTTAQAGFAEVI